MWGLFGFPEMGCHDDLHLPLALNVLRRIMDAILGDHFWVCGQIHMR